MVPQAGLAEAARSVKRGKVDSSRNSTLQLGGLKRVESEAAVPPTVGWSLRRLGRDLSAPLSALKGVRTYRQVSHH